MPADLVVFGDSVTWGQGLIDHHKFTSIVAGQSLTVKMKAHSGATIGIGDTHTGSCLPEAPNHYPTNVQQILASSEDPNNVAVVIVDGGINDIGVQTILNPLTSDAHLCHLVTKYCHDDMLDLLRILLARFNKSETRIVVTSYFPIFSPKSKLGGVLDYMSGLFLAPPPSLRSEVDEKAFALRSVHLAMLFWASSRAQLRAAVNSTGSSRVVFADVPFTEDNAMFAPAAWLFNVHFDGLKLVPEDEVIPERTEHCNKCHADPIGRSSCYIASAGHPNVLGAQQFANTIMGVLKS